MTRHPELGRPDADFRGLIPFNFGSSRVDVVTVDIGLLAAHLKTSAAAPFGIPDALSGSKRNDN